MTKCKEDIKAKYADKLEMCAQWKINRCEKVRDESEKDIYNEKMHGACEEIRKNALANAIKERFESDFGFKITIFDAVYAVYSNNSVKRDEFIVKLFEEFKTYNTIDIIGEKYGLDLKHKMLEGLDCQKANERKAECEDKIKKYEEFKNNIPKEAIKEKFESDFKYVLKACDGIYRDDDDEKDECKTRLFEEVKDYVIGEIIQEKYGRDFRWKAQWCPELNEWKIECEDKIKKYEEVKNTIDLPSELMKKICTETYKALQDEIKECETSNEQYLESGNEGEFYEEAIWDF